MARGDVKDGMGLKRGPKCYIEITIISEDFLS